MDTGMLFEVVLAYDDFTVIKRVDTGDYFYLPVGESTVVPVELTHKIVYTVYDDIEMDGTELINLYDNFCCGEAVYDDKIEYLWFSEKEEA